MPRSADYTILGFLYQFNKTILEILNSNDEDTIHVEGIVEDIEVQTPTAITAIQCKYHEANSKFTKSAIYKPLLQMILHFSDNDDSDIKYVLFAHFSEIGTPEPEIGGEVFRAAIESEDKELQKYISKIPSEVDLGKFESRFKMEFGPSYSEVVQEVGIALEANGYPKDDIETLAFPNAVNIVASLSIIHDEAQRKISKSQFLAQLSAIRSTAVSRWTMALKTRKKILDERRKQLKTFLDINARLRYFIIDPNSVENYDKEIVLFIRDYINKYHFKPTHLCTPLLCLCSSSEEVHEIEQRLYTKGILVTDGYVGGKFEESHFYRESMQSKIAHGKTHREFVLRMLAWEDNGQVINSRKCDDLFIIGNPICEELDLIDVNVEKLDGVTFQEIKYIMGVSNVYE